jgi:peptidyl-dipeptidase A
MLVHPPHGLVAETESQIVARMATDERWLREAVGVPAARAAGLAASLRRLSALESLIFARWSLVMAHFERALFVDPDGDLRTLWWDLIERFQLVPRPDDRHAPDWAAKIHLANFPGSYYVYILGQMVVSQLHAALRRDVGGLYGHADAGPYLVEHLYRLGRVADWEATVERATGRRLEPDDYAREWVGTE